MKVIRLLERYFIVSVFLAMVALFALNVVARELGGSLASQFAWIEEAVRTMNVFLVFVSLGLALEKGRHVGIDTLRNAMPQFAEATVKKLIDITGLCFSLYMAYLAVLLVQFVLKTGQRSPTLDIPMGWIYMAPVIGFLLLALRYGLSLFNVIDRWHVVEDLALEDGEASK